MKERQPFEQEVLEQLDMYDQETECEPKYHIFYKNQAKMDHGFK